MERCNLASQLAGTTVCSTAVSLAETPLTNLLTGGHWMADTFIKPPVTVTLHLPVPVRLSGLEWSSKVGTQSCLFHEVFVITEREALARVGGDCDCRQKSFAQYKVGSDRLSEEGQGRVVFTNRRLSTNTDGSRLYCRENYSALDRVCAVVIRITRTLNCSVPCLAHLKIFGRSSGLQQFRELEERILSNLRTRAEAGAGATSNTFRYFGGEQSQETSRPPDLTGAEDSGEAESEVPEEFLDSITHSLMSLPMTLPSGHLVDRTTVERCEEMFRSRGGQPRDPFTGKLFSQAYKPCFNPALKARIDRFVLTRRGLTSGGQTLGDAGTIEKFLRLNQPPARIGEKRKLHCDNTNLTSPLSEPVSVTANQDESDEETDNTDLSQALQRTLSKREKIIKR